MGCNLRVFVELPRDGVAVQGFLHTPELPNGDALVLTHGAGANSQSPLLVALARTFCESGLTVLRCDLPFRQLRPHGPPVRGSAERDQLGLKHAVEAIKKAVPGRVFAGGHSYGGRQTTLLAASEPELMAGLLLLSYPLHPPQRPEQMRTSHFPQLRTSGLFFTGTRDGFASIQEMTDALKLIPARTRLLTVANAGHELLSKKNQEALPQLVLEGFTEMFITGGATS
jgi:predicted alpha/beta-hydrolase family hydrolase